MARVPQNHWYEMFRLIIFIADQAVVQKPMIFQVSHESLPFCVNTLFGQIQSPRSMGQLLLLFERNDLAGQPQKLPFAKPSNCKILFNDWPYGLTDDIQQLVVWMKTRLETDDTTGELTEESRALVQSFVDKTFSGCVHKQETGVLGEDRVLWFKNVPKLQSVGALEHFHVIVRGASKAMLDSWTNGDVPMYQRRS
jgi:hypothetical protein